MTVNSAAFRQALGHFATGVAVATTLDGQHHPVGVTINSFNSVSLVPPLILFSLDKNALSHPIFLDASHFAINILAEDQQNISRHFAQSGASLEPWGSIEHTLGRHGCPYLGGCLHILECRKAHVYDGGDHTILVGEVLEMVKMAEKSPLLYYRGGYRQLLASPSEFQNRT